MKAARTTSSDLLGPTALEILDAVGDGVIVTDPARRVVWLNRVAAARLGVSLGDVAGKAVCEALHAGCEPKCALEGGDRAAVVLYRVTGATEPLAVEMRYHRVIGDNGRLVATVEILSASAGARPRAAFLGEDALPLPLVGSSAAIREVLEFVAEAAGAFSPILLTGESGVGKCAVARAIHRTGRRDEARFATFDCALRDARDLATLAKSMGNGPASTVYLERIERLGHDGQQRLRGMLEGCRSGDAVRPQVVASTRADLEAIVDRGGFDRELFYEINATALHVPALRERPADVPHIVERLLATLNDTSRSRSVDSVEPEALDVLLEYDYPENVRELVQIVEHAFAKCRGKQLRLRHLPERLLAPAAETDQEPCEEMSDSIEMLERDFMLRVLSENRWRLGDVAVQLNLSRTTLWRKLKRLGIENPRRT